MAQAILGTAGHIDHGKTALIRALTGVDTDRLPEERARGITIELGFTELTREGYTRLGVVDVPGHEAFVRTMVAGATGMDIVLLVVAADEGIMPQTVEHLDIVMLLGVPELVVALTKSDVVDDEWLRMVADDVRTLLAETPYRNAPIVATSAVSGAGLEVLLGELDAAATRARRRKADDLARLPVDRVFTVQGTGTVVTGTLWSGSVAVGERVRLLPGGFVARVRGVQVHGRDVERAEAGARAALALAGLERGVARRGLTVVNAAGWRETWMLTVRARILERAPKGIEHNQRVRVHLGTSEVLARCALLQEAPLSPGESGWIQLRLEDPAVARGRDRLVIRSYSPLITLGGGEVAEPVAPKRRLVAPSEIENLQRILDSGPASSVEGALEQAGWVGAPLPEIPVRCGVTPADAEAALASLTDTGTMIAGGRAFAVGVGIDAEERLSAALAAAHAKETLRPVVGLERLRTALPKWAHPALAGVVLDRMAANGTIELVEGGARLPGFEPSLDPGQARACRQLEAIYAGAGLAPPTVAELPDDLRTREDLQELLRYLEIRGVVRTLAEGLFIDAEALARAAEAVPRELGGRSGLGPADFRDVLPVTRKHLIPLLQYLDGLGVTTRSAKGRDVAPPDGSGVAES